MNDRPFPCRAIRRGGRLTLGLLGWIVVGVYFCSAGDDPRAGHPITPVPETGLLALQVNASSVELASARDLGAKGVRVTPNIAWYGVEKTLGGGYDWTVPDLTQKLVQTFNFENFRIISSTRPDDPGKPSCATETHTMFLLSSEDLRRRYREFVIAVVDRYNGDGNNDMPGLTRSVRRWSYTPEMGLNWCPSDDLDGFATMFELTADAIHTADPTSELLLPLNTKSTYLAAFADGYFPRSTIVLNGQTLNRPQVNALYGPYIAYIKAVLKRVRPDAYDLHLYGDADSIPWRKKWLLDYLQSQGIPLKQVYAMEGGEPFAVLGESFPQGPSSCPPAGFVMEDARRLAFQSAALARHFTLGYSSGFAVISFNLRSEYVDFGSDFGDMGLRDVCGFPRPAWYNLRLLQTRLGAYTGLIERSDENAPVRLFQFTFAPPGSEAWVAWDAGLAWGANTPHDLTNFLSFPTVRVLHAITAIGQTAASENAAPTSSVVFGPTPVILEPLVQGDLNSDGAINVVDLLILQACIEGVIPPGRPPCDCPSCGDWNMDWALTTEDAIALATMLAGE